MQFLNELEKNLTVYGKSVSKIIEGLQDRRGYISSNEIQQQKENLLQIV